MGPKKPSKCEPQDVSDDTVSPRGLVFLFAPRRPSNHNLHTHKIVTKGPLFAQGDNKGKRKSLWSGHRVFPLPTYVGEAKIGHTYAIHDGNKKKVFL